MLAHYPRRWTSITPALDQRLVFAGSSPLMQLDIEEINVDIQPSFIKPIRARWLITFIEKITQKTYCIIKDFVQAGSE